MRIGKTKRFEANREKRIEVNREKVRHPNMMFLGFGQFEKYKVSMESD